MEKVLFERNTFANRMKSMLKVDARRMFTMPLVYLMVGICFVMPILILVMTTMMDGSVSVNPQTGEETIIEGFDNTWQIIGTVSGTSSNQMSMDLVSMCNMNLVYFLLAVFVALFVADDFRSGYAKNLFTVRPKKGDYIISKTLMCSVGGFFMVLAFVVGSLLGGAIAGLPFEMVGFHPENLIMCLGAKIILVLVFVPIYLAISVSGKQKTWISLCGSMAIGMLFFMMIPALTPLNGTIVHVILCLGGGVLSSIGLGLVSNQILLKTSLV